MSSNTPTGGTPPGGTPPGGAPPGGAPPGTPSPGAGPSLSGGSPAESGEDDGASTAESDGNGQSRDFSHLFRSEGLVSDVDLRLEVARNYSKFVVGDEDISVDASIHGVNSAALVMRGSRDRSAGTYKQITDGEVMMDVGEEVRETVHGGVHVKAAFSAESIVGGAYANIITAAYLRVAAWTDFLAWGGWAEVDAIRCELSLLMIRSHVGYAHAAGIRVTAAARLIDDFQLRDEKFALYCPTAVNYVDTGAPGGGIYVEA